MAYGVDIGYAISYENSAYFNRYTYYYDPFTPQVRCDNPRIMIPRIPSHTTTLFYPNIPAQSAKVRNVLINLITRSSNYS